MTVGDEKLSQLQSDCYKHNKTKYQQAVPTVSDTKQTTERRKSERSLEVGAVQGEMGSVTKRRKSYGSDRDRTSQASRRTRCEKAFCSFVACGRLVGLAARALEPVCQSRTWFLQRHGPCALSSGDHKRRQTLRASSTKGGRRVDSPARATRSKTPRRLLPPCHGEWLSRDVGESLVVRSAPIMSSADGRGVRTDFMWLIPATFRPSLSV